MQNIVKNTIETQAKIPIISIENIFSEKYKKKECEKVAESFHKYGICIVKDPRVSEKDNDVFLDMMEKYFEQEHEIKIKDSRPELFYQIGSTPSFTEKPKNHCNKIVPGIDRPVTLCPPSKDSKWRFFWRIGKRPEITEFSKLNANQVIPENFKNEWSDNMNNWGNKLYKSVWDISGALARGLNLPEQLFQEMMLFGPHLLAPTGTNLKRFHKINTVMAGYHYDLNFITCHGKSRYPGLYIWLKSGKRIPVVIPDGCLLMQAGKQLEWMTGGYIKAGFHEVVVSDETQQKMKKREKIHKSLWRVSSTFFSHLRSDEFLEPLIGSESKKYPRIKVGEQVQNELKEISLA